MYEEVKNSKVIKMFKILQKKDFPGYNGSEKGYNASEKGYNSPEKSDSSQNQV
ncbi:MAG: hypothetical protein ACUVWJ_03220 [Spirochaetota bacterium]